MNSGFENMGFGLVVVLGFFTFKFVILFGVLVGWFVCFSGNTVFKVKYLPLPDSPVRAL